jgi:opacity protein-like surface antigen
MQGAWYIGMELGAAFAQKMKVVGMDNDVATTCDRFFVTDTSNAQGCNPPPSEWSNEVGMGSGVVAGLALGYRIQNLRVEGEYFYRRVSRDETTPLDIFDEVTRDKAEQELEIADAGIRNVLSHNLFANLYYDFHSERKLTPYLGIGAGTARTSLDYFVRFKRNTRPEAITTFPNHPDGTIADLNRLVAGTTTIGNPRLKDTLFGYQALAGLDYRVSDAFTMGLKVRWTGYFGKFEDRGEWDQLRSHDSARSPGGARVVYTITTEDLTSWGISLATKYQF